VKKDTSPNSLINESSPYLLQHAYNPVHWHSWNSAAFEKAKDTDRLMVISVGYSACHWCHVMERESFENTDVADFMNRHFISIKVDREERPDIDQIYMDAIQLIIGQGGWPLNVIATPDGRPVYACTYLPTEDWLEMLQKLVELKQLYPHKLEEQAESITNGIKRPIGILLNQADSVFDEKMLHTSFLEWEKQIDFEWGGNIGAPKFPMPAALSYLQDYAVFAKSSDAQLAVDVSLQKMARGGIFDHVGGGFSRYSVDKYWFAPHFEKMLYDNAQLISLYSKAYNQSKNGLYKQVVYMTGEFLKRELRDDSGLYCSALDADSEGHEGLYYLWKDEELQQILGDDYKLFAEFFTIRSLGNWKGGYNILFNSVSVKEIANRFHIKPEDVIAEVYQLQKLLLTHRQKRKSPALDYKILCSWNAMQVKAHADAYRSFGDEDFKTSAINTYSTLKRHLQKDDGSLFRKFAKGSASINAFLDDYAFMIDSAIALYQITFEFDYLADARFYADYCIEHFYDEDSGMFFYTSDLDSPLIARKHEIADNVIPSSNSVMGNNLFLLSKLFDSKDYLQYAKQMLLNVEASLKVSNSFMANWLKLYLNFTDHPYELVVTGKRPLELKAEIEKKTNRNCLFISGTEHNLPHLKNKNIHEEKIYICKNNTCFEPVSSVEDAIKLLHH